MGLVAFSLFALPLACSFAVINAIANHFKLTTALPFITILQVFAIWLFGSYSFLPTILSAF
jgi:hypothetical protein